MKKFALMGLAALILIIGGAVFSLLTNLDSLVKKAIETVGSEIAGVPVQVAEVRISLSDGRGTLKGLTVGNPAGFTSGTAFRLGEITLALDTGSVAKDPVVINSVLVAAPEVTYELGANGGSNIRAIQDHVKAAAGGGGKPAADKAGPRLVIDRLDITGGKVTLATPIPGAKAGGTLADIHLTGIGRASDGASPAKLAELLIGALSKSAIDSAALLGVGAPIDAIKGSVGKVDPSKAVDGLKGMLGR